MTCTSSTLTRCGSWSCSCSGPRRPCGSFWPPATICGWACTGCGWTVSWLRSAAQICDSRWRRRGNYSRLPAPTLVTLHDRTEGWAAGLRLAALLLGAHPDPLRFAVEFSGTERTVAEYLLAEVLDQQNGEVRQLLLRTSILERVNGELASLLTGDNGGERILQDLEQANAFVVSLDPARSWFRYHHMFADLLQMELRRTAPGEVAGLHRSASGWLAAHGFTVEAIRHAQAAHDWNLAAGLLVRHWPSLYPGRQGPGISRLAP